MSGNDAGANTVRSNDAPHRSAPTTTSAGTRASGRAPRAWPVLVLALPAFVAIWSGWVGLGELTGFGPVRPLPGIADRFQINSAITLPIGMETYASYALYVWLSGRIRADRTRSYAKYSAFGSLVLGAAGQIAYHLMQAAHLTSAPWLVTVLVACIPVAVLGMGAALAHMILREHHHDDPEPAPEPPVRSDPDPVHSGDTVHTVSVREYRSETHSTAAGLPPQPPLIELESPAAASSLVVPDAADRWSQIAESVCAADPAGRRDPAKVAAILRLKFEHHWTHSRIAEHVELSKASVTRTVTAAREHTNALEGGTGDDRNRID